MSKRSGWAAVLASVLLLAACGSSSDSGQTAASGTVPTASGSCGQAAPPPEQYTSVVVLSFENRQWKDVGLGFGPAMPYLHELGQQCSQFTDWAETDPGQNSLTQYVGQITGAAQSGVVNDCSPSPTCSTQADNLFRQARVAGQTAINFVEGATTGCSDEGNVAKHIPALYMCGAPTTKRTAIRRCDRSPSSTPTPYRTSRS